MNNFSTRFPAYSDLEIRAKRRLPRFVWDYLDSGTGEEVTTVANRRAFDDVKFVASVLEKRRDLKLSTTFLGQEYQLPIGFAPVGMAGLVWPRAERHLAKNANVAGVPFCLSTVAAATPEEIGPLVGTNGWFQLYPPEDVTVREDLMRRARDAGFHTLVMTVDLAAPSTRERLARARITNPMKIDLAIICQAALKLGWSLGTLKSGIPKLETIAKYIEVETRRGSTSHAGYKLRTSPDWDYLDAVRELWTGAVIVKGVMCPDIAAKLFSRGIDAVWVSNHGGRQFDAGQSSLEALPRIREAVGNKPLVFDSGVRTGTDVLKAIALGADLVMLGRAPLIALAALGPKGIAHYLALIRASLEADLGQLGFIEFENLKSRLVSQ